ncbi:MAG: alpha/beta hydrolase [Halanaerobiales bacterium]|nr:alpha/beta hydrolase [Halanaerobiales bacterium]
MENKVVELSNGIKINVHYNKNNTTKPAILFLHFESGNLHVFSGVIKKMKYQYQLVVPDLRGHGQSSKPQKGYQVEEVAEDIELLLRRLNIKKYYIVGSSFGAVVGIVLASRNQKKVKAIICEGVFSNESGKYSLFDINDKEINSIIKEKLNKEIDQRQEEYFDTKIEFIETRTRFFQRAGLWNKYFEEYIKHNVCKNEKDKFTSCYPLYAEKQYLKNYYSFQFKKYYNKIQCPILFLTTRSAYNKKKIKDAINRLGRMAGNYEIRIIPSFIHPYGWMKMPYQTADIILDFIKKY